MQKQAQFYLVLFIINLVTSIGTLGVQVYICKIELVRRKLSWIITVLSLLTFSFVTETILAALSYTIIDSTNVSTSMSLLLGIFGVLGGWTYASSFVIFALEYFEASSLIGLAKEGQSQAKFTRLSEGIRIVKIILITELFVSWMLLNVFYIQEVNQPGKKIYFLKGRYSENVETQVSEFAGTLIEYMLAAFLIVSLFKIKSSLKGSSFKFNAMVIHIIALICQFGTRWIADLSILFGSSNQTLQ